MSEHIRNSRVQRIALTALILMVCIFLVGRTVGHWRNEYSPVHKRMAQKVVDMRHPEMVKDDGIASSLPAGHVVVRIQVYQRLDIPKEVLDWENLPLPPEEAHIVAGHLMIFSELYTSSVSAVFDRDGDVANCDADLSKVNAQIDLHNFSCRDQIIFDRLFIGQHPPARFRDREPVVSPIRLRVGWAVLTPLVNASYDMRAITRDHHRSPTAVETYIGAHRGSYPQSQGYGPEDEKIALVTVTALAPAPSPAANRLESITEIDGAREYEKFDHAIEGRMKETRKVTRKSRACAFSRMRAIRPETGNHDDA